MNFPSILCLFELYLFYPLFSNFFAFFLRLCYNICKRTPGGTYERTIIHDSVNDIFDKPCECPVCAMKLKLENDAVAFAMGPSYMEDDIRLTTDKIGFCARHMQMMYDFENRLDLLSSWILT